MTETASVEGPIPTAVEAATVHTYVVAGLYRSTVIPSTVGLRSISMTTLPLSVHTKLNENMTPLLSSSVGKSHEAARLVACADT